MTRLLDGYYSRVDNSVEIDFANVNGQQIIEIATVNSMPPEVTNHYYVIDPKSNQAVPKNIFKEGRKFTNEMRSAMILGEPSELGLPKNSVDMAIIRRSRLAPTFSTYEEVYGGENTGPRMSRTVFRWNGQYYVAAHSNRAARGPRQKPTR